MLKKLLLSTLVGLSTAMPVMAENPDVTYRSLDSLGCIMLRECTEDVNQVKSVEDIQALLPDSDYETHKEELNALFEQLNALEIDVFVADQKYFPPRHRGIYDVKQNTFFLNPEYIWDDGHLIGVMRHEGWHAAQDCMAGSLNNTFTAVILQDGTVPQYIVDTVARTYPPQPRPWENEAFYAAVQPGMTTQALAACASETPMWETYTPTPMTREWLENKGFIQ